MIKKILAIVLIIISILLGLSFIAGLPNTVKMIVTIFSESSGYGKGYASGSVISSIIVLVITILLFRLGLKWLKNKPKKIDTINEIGKN